MNPYVIMTDTTADLPESYIKEHELAILSLSYTIDGTTYDRENPLDVREFYAKMRGGSMPTTAQVNPEQAKEAFKACLEQGKDVLYIAFSSGLSGTYGSAVIAAGSRISSSVSLKSSGTRISVGAMRVTSVGSSSRLVLAT